ncbi:MAG TPA: SCP2 sterol-binding domain-containing protein [Microthrixaceae bacterium]|nr:SCP2 sterol-binding domain-containing protein [Microthrixaceae bacterium]
MASTNPASTRRSKKRSDPTEAFFDDLAARGHEPLLARASGTVRIELHDGRRKEQWYLSIANGDLVVTRRGGDADAVLRTEKQLFDKLVTGRANTMAAFLRGAISFDGPFDLALLFQRLFPGPPPKRRRPATAARPER